MSRLKFTEIDAKYYREVDERFFKWMKDHWTSFEWTEEKVRRFLALNDAIIEKENNLYRLLSNVKADIENLLASGKTYYEEYHIYAYLSYEGEDYETPTGDLSKVYSATDFKHCTGFYTSAGKPLRAVEEVFQRGKDHWGKSLLFINRLANDEAFQRGEDHWKDNIYKIKLWEFPKKITNQPMALSLCKLMEEKTYTLEDLLWLEPDDFLECIEICN